MTIMESKPENAKGNLHAIDPEVNDMPNDIQSASERPVPQYMPNEDTWEPLLVAVESSDCQAGTVAIIPPVPKPVTMRATMNCPNEYEVPMSLIPRMRMVSSGSAPRSWHQTALVAHDVLTWRQSTAPQLQERWFCDGQEHHQEMCRPEIRRHPIV